MFKKMLDFGKKCFEKAKSVAMTVAVGAVVALGSLVSANAQAVDEGLGIVTKEAGAAPVFHPEALANPIIDAVISTAKWGALIALVGIGIYIIIRMFKGGSK